MDNVLKICLKVAFFQHLLEDYMLQQIEFFQETPITYQKISRNPFIL